MSECTDNFLDISNIQTNGRERAASRATRRDHSIPFFSIIFHSMSHSCPIFSTLFHSFSFSHYFHFISNYFMVFSTHYHSTQLSFHYMHLISTPFNFSQHIIELNSTSFNFFRPRLTSFLCSDLHSFNIIQLCSSVLNIIRI